MNYIHTRRRNYHETNSEKRFKHYARRTSEEFKCYSESEEVDEIEENHRALRVPNKSGKTQTRKATGNPQKEEQNCPTVTEKSDSMKILTETRDMIQTLVSQLKNQAESKKQQPQVAGGFSGRKTIQCYECKEYGHIVRDCPKSGRSRYSRGKVKENIPHQQPVQQLQNNSLN